MKHRRRAIVTGMIATYPVGGVVWDYAQYALALERLGFDVFYLEDTGLYGYDPAQDTYVGDCCYGAEFLRRSLGHLSPTLAERWHVRSADGPSYGLSSSEIERIVSEADVLLNVSGSALLRDEYMRCPCKILIDTDPGWNHFVTYPTWDANPGYLGTNGFRAHDAFFTYAELIGQVGCRLPTLGLEWHPTRPVVLNDAWQGVPPGNTWTTVMSWKPFDRPMTHDGRTYGTKEMEFPKFENLPNRVTPELEIAVGGTGAPVDRWRSSGWRVVDSVSVSRTAEAYRAYVLSSRGEFSVAKNVYVATRSGWFSCRSVCYLAAGRPVVVQDTGFSRVLPVGEGLLAFTSEDEAAQGIERVEMDYGRHAAAAREIAREHFDAERVLGKMLAIVGLN